MPCAESSKLGIRAGVLRTVLKSDGDSSCLQGVLSTTHLDLTDLTSPNSPYHASPPLYRLKTVVLLCYVLIAPISRCAHSIEPGIELLNRPSDNVLRSTKLFSSKPTRRQVLTPVPQSINNGPLGDHAAPASTMGHSRPGRMPGHSADFQQTGLQDSLSCFFSTRRGPGYHGGWCKNEPASMKSVGEHAHGSILFPQATRSWVQNRGTELC